MTRAIPIIPTILVVAAAAVMVSLGVWQLGRADEKAELIARYESALAETGEVEWPEPSEYEKVLFRRTSVNCTNVRGIDSIAGKSDRGRSGWVYVARCDHDAEGTADVTIGWSTDPNPPAWEGGQVTGRIAPYRESIRVIAEAPQAGLVPLAEPDPADLPNNHLAYAGQWFFFALTALVIYFLALRRRRQEGRKTLRED